MLYISLDVHKIKILLLKKSLLGQYETFFVGKDIPADMLTNGKLASPDVVASGIKELLNAVLPPQSKEREVILVIPQDSFIFFRSELPVDISTGVRDSFIREKARTMLDVDIDAYHFDHLIQENGPDKQLLVFGIEKSVLAQYMQPLQLLELRLAALIPEPFAYFKLFEKTLRQNKKEVIWYVSYEQDRLTGYVFDSYGLLEKERWSHEAPKKEIVEQLLQKQADVYMNKGMKLNRLILSGKEAETVRQDTFTKNVGVWTNPLKRIANHFYSDYLQILGDQPEKPLPILEYDTLIGAFIFFQENKTFSLLRHEESTKRTLPSLPLPRALPSFSLPMKAIGLFLISFGITFLAFFALSKYNLFNNGIKIPSIPFLAQATPTPTPSPTLTPPTPTPIPSVNRSEVKIKILNGSGIRGKANTVKEFFKSKGYEDILTGNADAFDYETTVIQIKKDNEALKDALTKDVTSQVEKPKFEELDEDEASDVIVIVGTDFK